MRHFEITAPKLYLRTHTPQQVGAVVSLDKPIDWLGAEFEAALEAQRPEECLPRTTSLILAQSPGGTEFTYLVQPMGKLERQNLGWLQRLQDADMTHSGVLAHYATGYWSGRECPEARGEPWEFRTHAVTIVERVGRSSREL